MAEKDESYCQPESDAIERPEQASSTDPVPTMYANAPGQMNFITLQQNLQSCLTIVDNEVMKNYVPMLQNCNIVAFDDSILEELNSDDRHIQFFRITELVYEEDEFSVHKLATVFHALSAKPCTLVLMIQSDGTTSHFYLGVRSRSSHSTATMKQQLEQSLLGLFPGSNTEVYLKEALIRDLHKENVGCISAVTCISDYKQDRDALENKSFIQGLEKFIYSMRGKAFSAICIANNLDHRELMDARREYEQIYTLMSPFANMQCNYSINRTSGVTESDTSGSSEGHTAGRSEGVNITQSEATSVQQGKNSAQTITNATGQNAAVTSGATHTVGVSDGTNESESITNTTGFFASKSKSAGISIQGLSAGSSRTVGVSHSVSRGKTHGTSHTDSVSDSISQNLTYGINSSHTVGNTIGENESKTNTETSGWGSQYSENEAYSISTNMSHTKALADTIGTSQAVTLNVQNKALINTLQRLEKQMERLDECESSGMWDFAAYFLGESAAEVETAAGLYRSIISGDRSGLQRGAINTWTEQAPVKEISKYVQNFLHPVFYYDIPNSTIPRQVLVDPTAMVSTRELAIQMGLPRKSVKGLPVIDHAAFAQEVLIKDGSTEASDSILLGEINRLGKKTETPVCLDVQSLSMHTFITGSTGSGKSNTVYRILSQLSAKKVNFLVVEPAKGEYRNIFGNTRDVSVYGTNPILSELLRINPFSFPKGIHIYEHLDRLIEIFNVCWPMYAAMPAILKDAIERAYVKAGWDLRRSKNKYADNLFPNFIDVLQQIDVVMDQSQYSGDNKGDYKGALSTRLRSLTNGINGLVFTSNEIPAPDLFDKNVIVDLSRVGSSETKSLIMGILVMKLQEHRIATCTEMNSKLRHVTVLEEAHNLLKRTSTEQSAESSNLLGKSVEMLTNAIAEMRTYGEGFIIADQSPGLLDMAVIRNTNTKIIMRLPEYSDRELVGRAASLTDDQITEIAKLKKGVAAIYQNDWLEAVLCNVRKHTPFDTAPYTYKSNDSRESTDIKGLLISKLMARNIYGLTEGLEREDIIKGNIPASAKCMLLRYLNTSKEQKLDSAAGLAYELFSANAAFSAMEGKRLGPDQKKHFLQDHIMPALTGLPDNFVSTIIYLITYHHALVTENTSAKMLLHYLIETERKEVASQ